MNEIEQRIASSTRPDPSAELDERIGRVVMRQQWVRRARAATVAASIVTLCGLALLIAIVWQDEPEHQVAESRDSGPMIHEPSLSSVVLLSDRQLPTWGTNDLAWQVTQD